jgi:hypothetical protein
VHETRLAAVRDQTLKGIGLEKPGTSVFGRLFANVPFFGAEWFEVCPVDAGCLTFTVSAA